MDTLDKDGFILLRPQYYRKKRLVIEAALVTEQLRIETPEGVMVANVGDYIIRGIKGELYPCKPDVFAASYEEA
jgi:hypothetical protein